MTTAQQLGRSIIAGSLLACLAAPVTAQVAGVAGLRVAAPIPLGPFEVRAQGNAEQVTSPARPRTALSLQADLRAPLGNGGLWIGSALEGAREIDTMPVRPLLRLGLWQAFHAIQMSIGTSSHTARIGGRPSTVRYVTTPDSLGNPQTRTFGDSGAPSRLARWSELEGRLSWRMGRATLGAVLAARPRVGGFQPNVWGHLSGTYEINAYLSLAASAGTDAPRVALGIPAVRFASLALRVGSFPWDALDHPGTAAAGLIVRPSGAGRYAITYRSPRASSVELSGDFDGWKPAPLTQTRPGVWQTTLIAAPGTYHVNLRVDGGAWFAPPGLPRAQDEFNGAVGILVLR